MVLLVSAGFSCRSAKQLSFRGLTLVGVSGLTGPHVSYHQVSLDFFFFSSVATLWGLRDLSSPAGNGTHAPEVKAPSPNHCTTREFPSLDFLMWWR